MRVLIAEFDLFREIGGGQTVYRRLVETCPDVEFHYFIKNEPANAIRPTNAHPIPYVETYSSHVFEGVFNDIYPPAWIYSHFFAANNFAALVAGQSFDIVEIPDYRHFGSLLRPALEFHRVCFDKIALSMHGNIFTTKRLNWFTEDEDDIPLDLMEQWQFQTVDLHYAISNSYIDEWHEIAPQRVHYLNPLRFMDFPKPGTVMPSAFPPDLNFIGRTEKTKGPDIFVDLVSWIPRTLFRNANIIGPDSYDPKGRPSSEHLREMAFKREVPINFFPAMSQAELAELFSTRSITFLPSRFDSLNLLALQSLFAGCPAAVGNGAGACRFFKEALPRVPFILIDMKSVYTCLPEIRSVLQDYDGYRRRLSDAITGSKPVIDGPTLSEIYAAPPDYDETARALLDNWYHRLMRFNEKNRSKDRHRLRLIGTRLASRLSPSMEECHGADGTAASNRLRIVWNFYQSFFAMLPEQSEDDLAKKLALCWDISSKSRIDRIRIWAELARLEKIRGNETVAVSYYLRSLRLLGNDAFGCLPYVTSALDRLGFPHEAQAARAMFGPPGERGKRINALIEQARVENLINPERDYEIFDDRRPARAFRVSVIVSLYKAATRLPLFLKTLENQTMIQSGQVEIILVDSGSPTKEYEAFKEFHAKSALPILYARSEERETIQSAWNRGISLSRAPYLTFLGVDETIVPDCLEILAAELDRDPSLDWVIGNSIVTEVDPHGLWKRDIMVYDRTGYRQDLVYLDTCYLSWVGALYRRSIHDSFGFYDATFRGAGDTEFKNRVMPFIKSRAIPRTLGIFLNYPDERTTQSPLAEIEDLRAWYMHRTQAGLQYAFGNRNPDDAEALFYDSLGYRKSYCGHWSTDIEMAVLLGTYLRGKKPNSPALHFLKEIEDVLNSYRTLDLMPNLTPRATMRYMQNTSELISTVKQRFNGASSGSPALEIFNDNRYEQHSNIWKTAPEEFRNRHKGRHLWH